MFRGFKSAFTLFPAKESPLLFLETNARTRILCEACWEDLSRAHRSGCDEFVNNPKMSSTDLRIKKFRLRSRHFFLSPSNLTVARLPMFKDGETIFQLSEAALQLTRGPTCTSRRIAVPTSTATHHTCRSPPLQRPLWRNICMPGVAL